MNFPLKAPSFLGALRWWPVNACGDGNDDQPIPVDNTNGYDVVTPRIHVYTFARNSANSINESMYDDTDDDDNQGDDVRNGDRSVEDIAVDLVAENLLPHLSPNKAGENSITNDAAKYCDRRQELNNLYSCNIRTHIVRDVAPGKVVVCVSFTVTSKLLRHMRGDFL